MPSTTPSSSLSFWSSRLITGLLWALLSACAVYWTLSLFYPIAKKSGTTTAAAVTQQTTALPDLTPQVLLALGGRKLLSDSSGASGINQEASTASQQERLTLLGILAVGRTGGAALISVDKQIAKPYRVGSEIAENLSLVSVSADSVTVAVKNTGSFELVLPSKK